MIDVFFDRLAYNHPIDYRNRLEINIYSVSLTDLLLQKLQIVQINDKDLKDGMLLLLAADIGEIDRARPADKDVINVKYLAKLLSEDWGFYYTATMNLSKIKVAMEKVAALTEENRTTIRSKADTILAYLERAPKSGKWKSREKVGTKKIWYNEVSDWE
jgi:hypothetical protein